MAHEWNVTPKNAVAIQKELQNKVRIEPYKGDIRTIAGADVSLNMFEKDIYAGIIVLSYPELQPLEYSVIKSRTDFPYIPGLLSFREIPALLECYEHLKIRPDIVLVDGQGIAHPRRLGIAAHFGVLINAPTIGVAKSVLYGKFRVPHDVGEAQPIMDPKTQENIGYAYKSKKNSNPLILSPGHMTDAEDALRIAEASLRSYRLPEATRLAHKLVNSFRKGENLQEYGRGSV